MSFLDNGVTGHRGDPQHFPQNTISGFTGAIKLDCDWVETDLRLTGDGRVVLSHDHHTLYEGDRRVLISESTLDELKKVNIAARFNMVHYDRPAIFEAIPTLEEALELFRAQDKVRLSLQPKEPGTVEAAARIIRQMKIPAEMLGFNDGNLEYMLQCKAEFPAATIFYDRGTLDTLADDIAVSLKNNFRYLVINENHLTQAATTAIQSAGLLPGVWNINNPGEMDRFIKMGVKRFYTDFPEVCMQKLRQAGF